MNFLNLFSPVAVEVDSFWFTQGKTSFGEKKYAGILSALECYTGKPVTGRFISKEGGIYHDLPLEAFELQGEQGILPSPRCYTKADVGAAVLEPWNLDKVCSVFDRNGERFGVGEILCFVHWPSGNELLYLVSVNGGLLLWPPHKLLLGTGTELPKWEKFYPEETLKKFLSLRRNS